MSLHTVHRSGPERNPGKKRARMHSEEQNFQIPRRGRGRLPQATIRRPIQTRRDSSNRGSMRKSLNRLSSYW
jgi:hypothetical protein